MPPSSHGKRGRIGNREWHTHDAIIPDFIPESSWVDKYQYVSGLHMKYSHDVHRRARHDPMNKHKDWGRMVMSKIAKACIKNGVKPKELFLLSDIDDDGHLDAAEIRRALLRVIPNLSDTEVVAIFAAFDQDNNGSVNKNEFCEALTRGASMPKLKAEVAKQWRNPVHNTHRNPPATYVERDDYQGRPDNSLRRFCAGQTDAVMGRLSQLLNRNTRDQRQQEDEASDRYCFFGGGADAARFTRMSQSVKKGKPSSAGNVVGAKKSPPLLPETTCALDLQPALRPGFLCSVENIKSLRSSGDDIDESFNRVEHNVHKARVTFRTALEAPQATWAAAKSGRKGSFGSKQPSAEKAAVKAAVKAVVKATVKADEKSGRRGSIFS